MRKKGFLFLFFWLSSTWVFAGDVSICNLDKNLYHREIEPKIISGIPFELMAVLISKGEIVQRKTLQINYNLWDEVIQIRSHRGSQDERSQERRSLPFARGFKGMCEALSFDRVNQGTKIRLLLNPMWSERIARLHLSVRPDLENKKLIGIDWDKIIQDMPSEKTLFEVELP